MVRKLPFVFLILLANSAYLAGHADATLFYFANVAFHLVLGAGLAIAAARRIPGWRAWPRTLLAAAPLLGLGALLGLVLAVIGATHDHAGILRAHIVATTAGSVLALGWLVGQMAGRAPRGERAALGSGLAVLAAVLVGTVFVVVK